MVTLSFCHSLSSTSDLNSLDFSACASSHLNADSVTSHKANNTKSHEYGERG